MGEIRFYGRTSNPKYFPFSNFYHAPFVDSVGLLWPTTEHYFQAQKFSPNAEIEIHHNEKVNNVNLRKYICYQPTPALAAKEGRRRDLPLRPDWEAVKDSAMFRAIFYKFTQHEDLRILLLSTGDDTIVEDSPIDYYWGCGKDGTGKNMLGKLLVDLRTQLRKGA